jgi:hypothetical protein
VRALLCEMSHLYPLDLYLWHTAREMFRAYREHVLNARLGADSKANNTTRAFFDDGSGIWLTEGWYAPVVNSYGIAEWAAGPDNVSKIKVIKKHGESKLQCVIAVVLGINVADIRFYRECGSVPLAPKKTELADGRVRLTVNIDDFQREETILLVVPRVSSLIQASEAETDTRRWAYKIAELSLNI